MTQDDDIVHFLSFRGKPLYRPDSEPRVHDIFGRLMERRHRLELAEMRVITLLPLRRTRRQTHFADWASHHHEIPTTTRYHHHGLPDNNDLNNHIMLWARGLGRSLKQARISLNQRHYYIYMT